MAADLSAALKVLNECVDNEKAHWSISDLDPPAVDVPVPALKALLAALDQAKGALEPFARALSIIESGLSLSITDEAGTIVVNDADFQEAAQVHAQLTNTGADKEA